MRRLPKWVWPVWVAAVALSFAALEAAGLVTASDGDTLSEWTRAVLGIEPVRAWRIAASSAFVVGLVGFVAWFVPHIVLRWGWWNPLSRKDDGG